MSDVRQKNINRPIIGQLNIHSIRNKFHFLKSGARKHPDILLISETNIDESFPWAQFLLDEFSKCYSLDPCANGEEILLYVRDDPSSCLLTECKLQDNTESLSIEINTRKKKWLLCCSHNANKNNISKYLLCLSKSLDTNTLANIITRSSRTEVFCKKGVLRNFAKFTGKHLCQSLFFNKVAGLEISKNTFFHRTPLVDASE